MRKRESRVAAVEPVEIGPIVCISGLVRLLSDGAGLKRAAESALGHGKPDAAERLADLVENTLNTERLLQHRIVVGARAIGETEVGLGCVRHGGTVIEVRAKPVGVDIVQSILRTRIAGVTRAVAV